MRWLIALAAVVASVVMLRAQLRPDDPQIIRIEAPRPAGGTAVARGKLLYERYGCVVCHGADAKGGFANPNSETDEKIPGLTKVAEGYTEAELVRLISHGTARIGRSDASGPVPPYRMPGWGDRLSDAEVKDLVRYLISLTPKTTTPGWR
jgi:mono/diheme cytochrome c family protein